MRHHAVALPLVAAAFAVTLAVFAAQHPAGRRPVWAARPAPAGAPMEAARVRIVDFGHDFTRFGDETGFSAIRVKVGRQDGMSVQTGGAVIETDAEVDGDPETADCAVYDEFSMTEPLSPRMPWYDREATSAHFYGGTVLLFANTQDGGFTEHGINPDHDSIQHEPRDNWALHMVTNRRESPWRGYAVWLWKKEDFLNGGADHRVSFDEESRLALYFQRYWMGWEGCRWVVQDGAQFYVSERTFSGAGPKGRGKQHFLEPLATRWAEYDPAAPHDIAFDPSAARFSKRDFQDVRAVGWHLFKDRMTTQVAGCKWYAFEVDAVVHRPQRPSESLNMASIPAGDGCPPFHISRCEVPYDLWKTVFRWARSNAFVADPRGFIFDRDGDMGSMDFGLLSHRLDEPVTDVTLHDVAAWCNALSQRESRTPCYYEDPEFRTVFRYVQRSPCYGEKRARPELHVRWDADGYRLPTMAEWLRACADQEPSAAPAWIASNSEGSTRPVGLKEGNGYGLFDVAVNVWELCWTAGDVFESAPRQLITVMGGDFRYPHDPRKASANPYGDEPFEGSYNIGFRVVRRESGAARPPTGEVPTAPGLDTAGPAPRWTIREGERTGAPENPTAPAPPVLDMVSIPKGSYARRGRGSVTIDTTISPFHMAVHEVTYARWKLVRDWAEAHGYTFSSDGDVGSMDYWGAEDRDAPRVHSPDEPVTDVTWHDCLVWCNALSELEGRTPVYCLDPEKQRVRRSAFEYRPLMMLQFEAQSADEEGVIEIQDAKAKAYMRWDADGYRLPTICERDYAMNAGKSPTYHWGDDPGGAEKYGWIFDNSRGTTHPVGRKLPNAFGLYDMVGNVSELCADAGYAERDDVRNPKGLVGRWKRWTSGWREGGSFFELNRSRYAIATGRYHETGQTPGGWGYPDLGFRVVRCAAGAHPPDGVEPKKVEVLLDLEGAPPYDPLEGRAYRGSLHRDGCFDATGVPDLTGLKWRFPTDGPIKSSPVVVDGVAYFGSDDGNVYAVDVEAGREVWHVKTDGKVRGSAALKDGVVYIGSNDGTLHALEAATGEVRWQRKVGEGKLCGSPAVAYGVVFIPTGNRGGLQEVRMVAGPTVGLDVETGEEVWRKFSQRGSQGFASPLIAGDTLYGDNCTSFEAIDLRTGKARWSVVSIGQSKQFNTMALSRGVIYNTGPLAGSVMAVDVRTGRKVWSQYAYEKQKHLRYGGGPGHEVLAGPAVAHGRVYVGCNDGYLYTFDAETGERGWKFRASEGIRSSASVAGQVVYFGCDDGNLYALEAVSGEKLWQFRTGGAIISSPWPSDGVVYVGSDDGCLYALH